MKITTKISALLLVGGLLIPATLTRAADSAPQSVLRKSYGGIPMLSTAARAQMNPSSVAATNIETLPNGVVIVPSIDRTAPRVAISLLVGEGAADETAANAGWRRLLVGAMSRQAPQGYALGDTKTEQQESLVNAAAQLGGTISVSVGDDVVEISVVGESTRGNELLKLALALLQMPRLSDETIDKVRTTQLDRIGAEDLDPTSRIDAAIRTQVFRDKSGDLIAYGLPDNGTATSVAALDNSKLRELQTRLAQAPLTVAAAGDVNLAALRETLAALPARAAVTASKPAFVTPKAGAPALKVSAADIEGAYVLVSYPLGDFASADGPAMRVLVAALSDAKGARLPARLSGDAKGAPQAETVSAQWLNRHYASEILITAQTDPKNVEGVKKVVIEEVGKLRATPLSAAELERAKAFARGNWALDRQNLRDRAFLTGLPTAIGALPDASWEARLNAVTSDDVKRVANKYLQTYAVAQVLPKE